MIVCQGNAVHQRPSQEKRPWQSLVSFCFLRYGHLKTVQALDRLKNSASSMPQGGISIGVDDMVTPPDKPRLVADAEDEVVKVEQQYKDGVITNGERYNKVVAIWSEVTER